VSVTLPPSKLSDRPPLDPEQTKVLEHDRGTLLVTGGPGTGKTTALRERFARLIESGADPERVALVVRSRAATAPARRALLARLARALPGMRVLTAHGLALHVVTQRYEALGYERPPEVLSALDQLTRVRDLLAEEDPAEWPAYGALLGLRGFADEVRQFLTRAQEALLRPEEVRDRAQARGLHAWRELARLYRRYLDVLNDEGTVDFAGLVVQAAAASRHTPPAFDHLLVDDYQEATVAEEALLAALAPESLVVAGDAGSHVFSFQGTTDVPLRRFVRTFPTAGLVELTVPHRAARPLLEAWVAEHSSEEHAAVAREVRRIHVEDGVPWSELAVVVRRGQGADIAGLLRALDDAGVPRSAPEGGPSPSTDPLAVPYELALRWVARHVERDGLVEPLLTSDLAGLSPASARALVRGARAAGEPPAAALDRTEGLTGEEQEALGALRGALAAAEAVAERSVLDAFAILWRELPISARLVRGSEGSARGRRDMDGVLAFADAVAGAAERADRSTSSFLDLLDAGQEEPDVAAARLPEDPDAVRVLTAHGAAGMEFDTVVVVDAVEGNFPSLTRPEPMFDLSVLEARVPQSARNRLRLEDERRLFDVVTSRARRRVLITASDPHADEGLLTLRSRFVGHRGIAWSPAPVAAAGDPLSVEEAAGRWRRTLAGDGPAPERLAALSGLLALGDRPAAWWYQRDWTGTPGPLHQGIRVSFSKLDTLENCSLQFVLSEELGLEGEAGYYAWVGHLVHKIIEDCENGLVDRTVEGLVSAAEERWSEAAFPSRAVSEAFRRAVTTTMLPAWLREYGGSPALAKELRFEFDYEGATVTGFIDRVSGVQTGGTQITDYKTGKSRGKSAEDNLQLGIYFLAVNKAEELAEYRPVKAVELAFLKDLRDGRIVRVWRAMTSQQQAEFGARMAERLAGLIGRIGELQATEVYRPSTRAQCRFCDFKSLCPLWPEGRELLAVSP
jgi:superfamily I DNA/RNA helicase/RecB family exonuclease